MPPKKATTNGDGNEAGGPFKWEGPNDFKLLLMTQGRYVKPDEYEQLSSAIPGTTVGSIRNRISSLRVKQRDLYDAQGWTLPEGGAGHSAKKTSAKKRGASAIAEGGDGSVVPETPSKKPRGKKAKKSEAEVKKQEESEEGGSAGEKETDKIKEEVLDGEI